MRQHEVNHGCGPAGGDAARELAGRGRLAKPRGASGNSVRALRARGDAWLVEFGVTCARALAAAAASGADRRVSVAEIVAFVIALFRFDEIGEVDAATVGVSKVSRRASGLAASESIAARIRARRVHVGELVAWTTGFGAAFGLICFVSGSCALVVARRSCSWPARPRCGLRLGASSTARSCLLRSRCQAIRCLRARTRQSIHSHDLAGCARRARAAASRVVSAVRIAAARLPALVRIALERGHHDRRRARAAPAGCSATAARSASRCTR